MDQETNLAGMSPEDAKRYILAHITDLNLLRKRIDELRSELDTWKNRASLAASKGISDLAAGAEAQAARVSEALAPLLAEAEGLKRDIEYMKEQVPGLAARERSVDPDRLLANLQMATGEMDDPDKGRIEKDFKDAEADASLARLKRSLGMEPPPASPDPAASGAPPDSGPEDASEADGAAGNEDGEERKG